MANNTNDQDIDLGEESLDLDALDNLFDDPAPVDNEPKPTKGKPVRDLITGFKKGFLNPERNKALIKSFVRTSLPSGYGRLLGVAENSVDAAISIKNTIEQTKPQELDAVAQKVQKLLPRLKKVAPSKVYAKLEKGLEEKREDLKFNARMGSSQAQRDREAQQRQEESDDALIAEALNTNASMMGEMFEASQQASRDYQAEERTRGEIRDRVSNTHFNGLAQQMMGVNNLLSRQVAYQDQVTYQFQRKGLEIQYRSFFALRDIRKLAQDSLLIQKQVGEALVHNTGLPEHMKASMREMLSYGLSRRAADKVTDVAYQALPNFLAGFAPGILNNITKMGQDGTSKLSGMLGMGDAMGGMVDVNQLKQQKFDLLGQMLGNKAGSMIGKNLLPFASRKVQPWLVNKSNQYGGHHNLAEYYLDNASSIIQDYVNDGQRNTGLAGTIAKEMAKKIFPQFSLDNRLTDGGYQTIGNAAAFNQLTQRSITDIIPGYLARILQEVRMVRTGRDDIELEVYDNTSGSFTGKGKYLKNVVNRVATSGVQQAVSNSVNDTLNTMDADGKLSKEARHALAERLLRDASTNKHFDPSKYARGTGYSDKLDASVIQELSEFFKGKFEFDDNGETLRNSANNEKLNQFSKAFQSIKANAQNPGAEIAKLFTHGNAEALREMGLVYTEQGIDRINFEKLWELYRSGVTDTNNGPRPDEPPKPKDKTLSELFKEKVKDRVDPYVNKVKTKVVDTYNDLDLADIDWGKVVKDIQDKASTLKVPDVRNIDWKSIRDMLPKMPDLDWEVLKTRLMGIELPELRNPFAGRGVNLPPMPDNWPDLGAAKDRISEMVGEIKVPKIDLADLKDKAGSINLPDLEALKGKLPTLDAIRDSMSQLQLPDLSGLKGKLPSIKGSQEVDILQDFTDPAQQQAALTIVAMQSMGMISPEQAQASLSALMAPTGERTEETGIVEKAKEQAMQSINSIMALPAPSGKPVLALPHLKDNLPAVYKESLPATIEGSTNLSRITPEEVQEHLDRLVNTKEGFNPSLLERVFDGIRQLAQQGAGKNVVQEKIQAVRHQVARLAHESASGVEQATDVMVKGANEVAIRAQDIKDGKLRDLATGNLIEKLSDIKGAVVDQFGNQVVTAAEAARGLVTTAGHNLSTLGANTHPQLIGRAQAVLDQIHQAINKKNGFLSRIKDLFIPGRKEPALLARDIEQGLYLDVNTDQVIQTLDDITGEVKDLEGNTVITQQEFDDGLVMSDGMPLRKSRIRSAINKYLHVTTRPTVFLAKAMKYFAKQAYYKVAKRLFTMDAYLPGVDKPVLRANELKRGGYFDAQGNVLQSFDDLRDGVYDVHGNEVVSAEQIPELVNPDGTKHTAAKRRGIIRRLGKKLVRGVGNLVKRGAKGYLNMTKNYYKWLGKKIASPVTKRFDKIMGSNKPINPKDLDTPTDGILARILNTLDRRLPKEAAKRGSWQEKLEREANDEKARLDKRKERDDARKGGVGGMISGALKGLMDKFRGNKDEEDEEGRDWLSDASDVAEIRDGLRGDGSGENDGKKGRKRKGKGKKGFVGRTLDKAKNSRVGQWIAKKGGTGLAARAAMAAGGLMEGGGLLATAGSAVAGLFSLPVLVGAAAVTAVGAGGYYLWKRHSDTSGDFRSLRLMQYGLWNTSDQLKILEFESLIETVTSKGKEPSFSLRGLKPEQVFDALGIDADDYDTIASMSKWVEYRFKPVYLAWVKAMDALNLGSNKINELDDKIPDSKKLDFLNNVKIPTSGPSSPFQFTINPLYKDEQVKVSSADIDAKYAELETKFKKLTGKEEPKQDKAVASKAASEVSTPGAKEAGVVAAGAVAAKVAATPGTTGVGQGKVPGVVDRALATAGTAVGAAVNFMVPTANASSMERPSTSMLSAEQANTADNFGTRVTAMGHGAIAMSLPKSAVVSMSTFNGNILTALQAVRMRAYGLGILSRDKVQAIFSIEDMVFAGTQVNSEFVAEYTGDPEMLLEEMGRLFGIDANDLESPDRERMVRWVEQRFIPVAMAYASAARQQGVANLARVEQALKGTGKLFVANAIMAAKSEVNGSSRSVWQCYNFFSDANDAEYLKGLAKIDIAVLEKEADKDKKIATPTMTAGAQGAAAAAGKEAAPTNGGSESGVAETVSSGLKDFAQSVGTGVSSAYSKVKDFFGFGGESKPTPSSGSNSAPVGVMASSTYTPGGATGAMGNVFNGMTDGNGGQWEQIPFPKANKSREAAMPTLQAIQAITGVDAELLATFCSIESGFNYSVKAPTSSATGWFQFINGTWDGMIAKYASKFGLPADSRDRKLRLDPRINGLMGAMFLKDNYNVLAKGLGRAPTDTDLYAAHFLGAGTAVKILKCDRNAIAASILPQQAAANRSIFYKPAGGARTVGEFYELLDSKVSKHRKGGTDPKRQILGNESDPAKLAEDQAKAAAATAASDLPAANDHMNGKNAQAAEAAQAAPAATQAGSPAIAGVTPIAPGQGTVGVMPINQQATSTVNPLNTAAGAGVPTTVAPASENTPVGSGQSDTAVVKSQNTALAKAAALDKIAQDKAKESMAADKAANDIQLKQLEAQEQMRDYLKIIAEKMGVLATPAKPENGPSSKPASNGMTNATQNVRETRVGNTPAPISMTR